MSNSSLISPQFLKSSSQSRLLAFLTVLGLAAVFTVSGCSKKNEKTEDVRPVRAISAVLEGSEIASEFSGEVRPRIESRLGFRVPGKIIARKVDVGTEVRRGQVLMQLDPQDLLLGQVQAKAGLSAAESNRDLAKAELKRYQELREKNFVAQAVLDAKETAYKAAQASYEQAKAGLSNQSNQASYASLVADVDGVVTGIDAEVGQVVAAGTPVVRVAKTGELDVVVGIPEDKINGIRRMSDVKVRMWANQSQVITAKLRELSPVADPITRTFTAKVALSPDVKDVRLGMTAMVSFGMKNPQAMIRLPLTALLQDKSLNSVWVVDAGAVRLVPVTLGGTAGEDVLIASGLSSGQMVVTAGVNLLKSGQKVKILGVGAAPDAAVVAAKASGVAK